MSGSFRLVALCGLVLFGASCSPDPAQRELLLEMRAQNQLLKRQFTQQGGAQDVSAGLAQAAVAPLQEVLVELAKNQRDLSARQATLTQEMRQWTQLLVESMHAEQSDQAVALGKRLEALEKTIQQQDARHREVEDLMGTALTRTADQLQKFLERLNKVEPQGASPASADPKQEGSKPAAGAVGNPERGEPVGGAKGDPAGGDDEQQQASMWPLWAVAVLAIASGVWLLLPRRRRPVGIAPEMQVPTQDDPASLEAGEPAEVLAEEPAEPPSGEPEVEELWTAAALLGEAIGRIKQSGGSVPAELQEVFPGGGFDAAQAPAHVGGEPRFERSSEPEPDGGTAHSAPLRRADQDDLFVLEEQAEAVGDYFARGEPVAEPEHEPAPAPPVRPSVPDRLAAMPRPESITCRLPAADVAAAEGQILDLLGGDPRVLVQPAPRVERRNDAVEVSFALLPDLPPGERALLEQRLRDAAF